MAGFGAVFEVFGQKMRGGKKRFADKERQNWQLPRQEAKCLTIKKALYKPAGGSHEFVDYNNLRLNCLLKRINYQSLVSIPDGPGITHCTDNALYILI